MKRLIYPFCLFISTISLAQNVGIGTTTPDVRLHVTDSVSGTAQAIKLQGNLPYIGFYSLNNTYKGYLWENGNGMQLGTSDATPVTIAPAFNIRASFLANGDVGIGTTTPAARLHVTGNVRADTFRHNSPKTYYHMIPSVDFSAREAGDFVRKTIGVGYAYINANSPFGWGLTAGLKLPDGARVQQVVAYVIDNSATSNIEVLIRGEGAAAGVIFNPMSGSNTTGAPGNATLTMNAGPLPFIINNQTSIYYIIVSATSEWNFSALGVRGIRVEYTLEDL